MVDVLDQVRVPSEVTLKKYGLSKTEWLDMAREQGGACFVCEKVPTTGRLVIDHEHQKGWKKMPPEQRKKAVRGILCWYCNHAYVGRAITAKKSRRVTLYLERYEAKK